MDQVNNDLPPVFHAPMSYPAMIELFPVNREPSFMGLKIDRKNADLTLHVGRVVVYWGWGWRWQVRWMDGVRSFWRGY